ncbi:phosphatase [Oceanicola sp. 22II-s10i]|uniref:HAD family hydrolase n=1 Tax=Oceanicola sp. 22II-s10i TaxID=1317116 RepID=UPI000B521B93|nr:HAD family hydrolase [Oceanicola sp. 22II-s10i]OWU82895.1 phosphatase [Oceanicola sp. 22II-s10i]
MRIDGIIFDKDGTLFDFGATWNAWAGRVIEDSSGGDPEIARRVADSMRYDLEARTFLPDSPVIAGTNREAAELVVQGNPALSVEETEVLLMTRAAEAPQVSAVPLVPLLSALRDRGLRIGLMTNDTEFSARAHLDAAGVTDLFDMVIGFDSGYGAKPDPDPLLAFAAQMDLTPARVAMVGDSTHDLIAGRAAGMIPVAVLTGMAQRGELEEFADLVLPDIGHIPGWLDTH